jgi:hypothetical protein
VWGTGLWARLLRWPLLLAAVGSVRRGPFLQQPLSLPPSWSVRALACLRYRRALRPLRHRRRPASRRRQQQQLERLDWTGQEALSHASAARSREAAQSGGAMWMDGGGRCCQCLSPLSLAAFPSTGCLAFGVGCFGGQAARPTARRKNNDTTAEYDGCILCECTPRIRVLR